MMDYHQLEWVASSCHDSLEAIKSDIHHANMLAASISRTKGSACLQMKLVYHHFSPVYLFLLQWFNCSCLCLLTDYLNLFHIVIYKVHLESKQKFPTHGRKATIGQFYVKSSTYSTSKRVYFAAVILPSLEHLHDSSLELDSYQDEVHGFDKFVQRKRTIILSHWMSIWRETMNVEFAWSLVPRWSCQIAVLQCASTATLTGI